jgi:hypothetical protein
MIHGHSRRASRSSLGRAAMADGLNLGGANAQAAGELLEAALGGAADSLRTDIRI